MPHVMGVAGNIVAILWGTRDALHSPPRQDANNKILLELRRIGSIVAARTAYPGVSLLR